MMKLWAFKKLYKFYKSTMFTPVVNFAIFI